MKHPLDCRAALRLHLERKTRMTTESIAVAVLGANRNQVTQVQKDLETNAQALGITQVNPGYWELVSEPASTNAGQMDSSHPKVMASISEARKMGQEGIKFSWTGLGVRASVACGETIDGTKWYSSSTGKRFRDAIERAYDEGHSVYQEHQEQEANIEQELQELEASNGFHADAATASIQIFTNGHLPEIPEPTDEDLSLTQEIQILEEELTEARATIAALEAQQGTSTPLPMQSIKADPRAALLGLVAALEERLGEAEAKQREFSQQVQRLNLQIDAAQKFLQTLEC